MTLQNLLATQSLIAFSARREDIQRLLTAAERNLHDASITAISDENRFDAAYKCIMQCAMAALWANGYRTSTTPTAVEECQRQARGLLGLVKSWLKENRPDFC
ncbi:hypothetical protein [Rugamonas apoptosis]|uniref:Uncharacterized protein n=1 Tax=Rugamonas apoptosis TaxID=2758570 RepID=A0A7W2FCA5_9BURK|nr:hypothetical protein [Rugamonas apoptosis]MBA5688994.1 hypothetical protein [Rugamonas apoptosis]